MPPAPETAAAVEHIAGPLARMRAAEAKHWHANTQPTAASRSPRPAITWLAHPYVLPACRDRLLYTLVCLAIFLVCSQLPLYGVKTTSGADPLYWARVIMASSRGTVGAGYARGAPAPGCAAMGCACMRALHGVAALARQAEWRPPADLCQHGAVHGSA